ncbi:MAG TPA: hypothetical protein VKK79_20955, partial [Candidatus Lokiarchaeia archaeon]|nr:hypothetical protein [Candidatus Lokiarchaeia archaeon]
FGADIVVRGEQVDYPKSQWVDEQGNPTDQGQFVDNREVGMKVNYFGYFDKSEILPNGHVYTWYYGPHLKTENEFINWFDTYGWPHELPVKDSGSEISETNGRFNDVIHVIPSYGPSTFTSSMMMFGENRLGIFQSEKSGVFATHY